METVVSMLQEDAVALATGPFLPPPTPQMQVLLVPCTRVPGGLQGGGRAAAEQGRVAADGAEVCQAKAAK